MTSASSFMRQSGRTGRSISEDIYNPSRSTDMNIRLLLSTVFLGIASAYGAAPPDILIYKGTTTYNWKQYEAQRDNLPASTTNLRGRNVLSGVMNWKFYWIIDRGNQVVTEVRYYTAYENDVKKKLYEVLTYTFTDLKLDPDAYTDDRSGNDDQLFELMTMPSSKVGVNKQSLRSSWDYWWGDANEDEYDTVVWDKIGSTAALVKLSATASVSDAASTLAGQNRYSYVYRLKDGGALTYIFVETAYGTGTLTLDKPLTLKARNTVVQPPLVAGTMNNAVQAVANALHALGYDLYIGD